MLYSVLVSVDFRNDEPAEYRLWDDARFVSIRGLLQWLATAHNDQRLWDIVNTYDIYNDEEWVCRALNAYKFYVYNDIDGIRREFLEVGHNFRLQYAEEE